MDIYSIMYLINGRRRTSFVPIAGGNSEHFQRSATIKFLFLEGARVYLVAPGVIRNYTGVSSV